MLESIQKRYQALLQERDFEGIAELAREHYIDLTGWLIQYTGPVDGDEQPTGVILACREKTEKSAKRGVTTYITVHWSDWDSSDDFSDWIYLSTEIVLIEPPHVE